MARASLTNATAAIAPATTLQVHQMGDSYPKVMYASPKPPSTPVSVAMRAAAIRYAKERDVADADIHQNE